MSTSSYIPVNTNILRPLINRYKISALWVFGSVLRDNWSPESDLDLIIEFSPEAKPTLLTLASIEADLEEIYHRKIDLITRTALDENMNPILKREILSSMVQIYGS